MYVSIFGFVFGIYNAETLETMVLIFTMVLKTMVLCLVYNAETMVLSILSSSKMAT